MTGRFRVKYTDTKNNFESGPQAVGKAVAGRPGFEGILDKVRGLCGCENQ